MRKAVFVVLALVAAFMLVGAPSHASNIPVVPPGCVLTGGGVACGAGSGSSAPAEPPAPIVVESTPPAPSLAADCSAVDPDLTDVWSYIATPDPVGGTVQVDAFVPEGYVIGDSGKRYWSSVASVWEMVCPVAEPAPVEPAPVDPAQPAPDAPVTPETVTPAPLTELPATGPADWLLPLSAAGVLMTAGVLLVRRTARR